MRTMLLPIGLLVFALGACEEQTGPRTATTTPVQDPELEDEDVDVDALRRPGSADYYGAVAGGKKSAERLKGKIDDYNDELENEIDDLFND